MKEQDKI